MSHSFYVRTARMITARAAWNKPGSVLRRAKKKAARKGRSLCRA
ncbi:MAG TPA: hypothetical protein VFX30_06310 [bacterium]|nr:hypothetical protein [bacterium]